MRLLISLVTITFFCVDCCAQVNVRSNPVDYLSRLAENEIATATDLLRRGATWSARNHCTEAMRLLASSQDGKAQGNAQSKNLAMAFQCLREAEDFVVGLHETAALQRVIESHETPILKGGQRDDERRVVSAVFAHGAYLEFSKSCFQRALQNRASLGSEVVLLYGRATLGAKDAQAWHRLAVVKTLYEVAISLDANHAFAHRELGVLLHDAGDIELAMRHLLTSIKLAPTRRGYEFLHKAASAQGLKEVASTCASQLASGNYLSGIKVRSMSPAEFAATHGGFSRVTSAGHDGMGKKPNSDNAHREIERVVDVPAWKKLLGKKWQLAR